MDGSDNLLALYLKARMPEVFSRAQDTRVDVTVKHSLEDARKKLISLGLPPLEIEGDYEETTDSTKN
jgi:hypothetical protein